MANNELNDDELHAAFGAGTPGNWRRYHEKKQKARREAEAALSEMADRCCHLFPNESFWPVKCGSARICVMQWNPDSTRFRFVWFDRPLDLERLKEEAK
jgi:hypothetical protein